MSGRSVSVYIDTSASHEYLYTDTKRTRNYLSNDLKQSFFQITFEKNVKNLELRFENSYIVKTHVNSSRLRMLKA